MPKVKAFKGIHPATEMADAVVLPMENFSLEKARSIRKENPHSYVNMLVPKIENPYLRGSKRELAYKKINENFEEFIEKNILIEDDKFSIYIYQINHKDLIQTGIWTVTSIDDYLNNTVKKHELTRADREKSLIDYLQQTGIDANPVLIAYRGNARLNEMISETIKQTPLLDFSTVDQHHKLWKIDDDATVKTIINRFAELDSTYIADGHHRAAAACMLGIERRKLNLKHTGNEEYNFFSTVYMSDDQLKIVEYNRLIKDLNNQSQDEFLYRLSENFTITKIVDDSHVKPSSFHQFGVYLSGSWYKLEAKSQTYNSSNPVALLDVSILQDFVLKPILGIENPRIDSRLSFVGGTTSIDELVSMVDKGEYAAAFILFPTSIEQLILVADAREVMPPKSTWFEPKFLSGLLIHQIS